MLRYHSINIPIQTIVSFTSISYRAFYIIGVSALFDVSNITWNVGGLLPTSIKTLGNGITLYYDKQSITPYNLRIGTIQPNYAGANILEYLQSADSYFGNYATEQFIDTDDDTEIVQPARIKAVSHDALDYLRPQSVTPQETSVMKKPIVPSVGVVSMIGAGLFLVASVFGTIALVNQSGANPTDAVIDAMRQRSDTPPNRTRAGYVDPDTKHQ